MSELKVLKLQNNDFDSQLHVYLYGFILESVIPCEYKTYFYKVFSFIKWLKGEKLLEGMNEPGLTFDFNLFLSSRPSRAPGVVQKQ